MRIMLVNKYHYLKGGDCRYVFELAELLKNHGHEVRHFSVHHPKNFKYDYSDDFVSYIDFPEEMKKKGVKAKVKVLTRMLYSREARKKFRAALDEFKPDIIHFNNIHKHLTTSILLEANRRGIPVVWTLHDYNLICPNISFISKNSICERCKRSKYLAPIKERCSNNSVAASTSIAAEHFLHEIQRVKDRINIFIAPSEFLMKKFVEYKYPEERMVVIPNFYEIKKEQKANKTVKKYFLFLGRLGAEKGIESLCKAAKEAKISLVVAGEGPLKESLEKEYGSKDIKFVGHKSGQELANLRKNAWFLVIPSEWYENNPFSVIESFADGVPAIGADIGGIPELVKDGKTGFLFKLKDIEGLKALLLKTNKISREKRNLLGENGRKSIRSHNDPEDYYDKLLSVYKKAIKEGSVWKH